MRPIVIGAGPAGLTAAYALSKAGTPPLVLEASQEIGGISRTERLDGYRYDLGGHRFFSKSAEVEALWDELASEPLLKRPRLSRIFYDGEFYDYPLRLGNALGNMGVVASIGVGASYVAARLRPQKNEESFEAWVTNRFGRRLYRMFFESYTEKVWGRPCGDISAEWAAQRIRNLSLSKAVLNAIGLGRRGEVTTLIDEFRYPRLGPGQLWEACADKCRAMGADIRVGETAVAFETEGSCERPLVTAVRTRDADGSQHRYETDWVASSMPLRDLLPAFPEAPEQMRDIASRLGYRGFVIAACVVSEPDLFPDNWVYVHSGAVRLARVQNVGNWSPAMVPEEGTSCLGLEFFADPGDDLWTMPDEDLIALGDREVRAIGLVRRGRLLRGGVTRVPDAYPIYEQRHALVFAPLQKWLAGLPNLVCIGRNGQHRYNNMDHSMTTALLAVRSHLDGRPLDVWAVNAESEYHEEGD